MITPIISWLVLAISTISIFSDVARASASASAQYLSVDQRSLLLELRNSLVFNASKSSKLVQWDRSADSWSGVTCEDGLVVGLDLSNESISGGINGSSSLFRLEFLRSLNLAINDFNYTAIPSGLANFSRLEHLNLSEAGFAGQIPAELSRLTKLRTLDLRWAWLKLEKPNLRSLIRDFGELRELYLNDVNVSAEGSEWCDALSSSVQKLEVLSMSYCDLSGPIDASLMSLVNLSVIQLNGNNLSTTVPSFLANFSSLKTLSLFDCGLQGEFPQEVFQLQTLQNLDISTNELLRVSVPDFLKDSSLETLALWGTNISGRIPDSIGNLRKLSKLDLFNCSVSGSIPASMKNLSKLTYLDLSRNNLIGSVPPFGASRELTYLDLSRNNLTGSVPPFGASRELIYLDLSRNNLTGSIPPFGASRELTYLDLSDNALTGQITSVGWEDLLNLAIMYLDGNSLEGDIPPALFTLPQLMEIRLSSNRFNGQLIIYPNVSSCQLRSLDLGSNLLQGSVPASIFELQSLYFLSLSYNNFNGSINIDVLRGLGNLTILDLSYSGLSINAMAPASAIASSFPEYNHLYLASCRLRTFPRFLANQSELVSLDLSHNYIQGKIPQWIWTLRDLKYLNLSKNYFENLETPLHNLSSSLSTINLRSKVLRGNMLPLPRSVEYLDFSSNNITSVIPNNIGDHLSSSTWLFSLSKNNFYGSIPKSICKLSYLEVLDLSHNHLNGTIPNCLMMASLKVLNLRNNCLSGVIPQNIPTTCGLKTLDISENLLWGQIPLSLANCRTLEIMNIGDNQIDGKFPCHFIAISSLRVLILRSNKLHGEIGCSHSPYTWQKLQIIDLSSNHFNGMLPASFLASWEAMKVNVDFNHLQCEINPSSGRYYQDTVSVTFKGLKQELVKILTIFTSIDFSSNRFEGPIPYTLGDLKALYILNLSHNAISGSIPSIIGNLDQLESLDLSGNYLNGTIPAQLANLDFLSFLNLSNNQLVGSIPDSGHFLTFSKSSFERNAGLCGLALNKSCSITRNKTEVASDGGINDDSEKKWFYLSIPLGFVIGFWVFCGPLVFIRSWRYAYYRFWDKVLSRHSRP
ncbi:hypothetical protein BT93_A0654 [Corymbia citriodora subsp. variegata]|nr:hypothetical protein BT93_A0654 [Corymbia citriodora subsp. variegata]